MHGRCMRLCKTLSRYMVLGRTAKQAKRAWSCGERADTSHRCYLRQQSTSTAAHNMRLLSCLRTALAATESGGAAHCCTLPAAFDCGRLQPHPNGYKCFLARQSIVDCNAQAHTSHDERALVKLGKPCQR